MIDAALALLEEKGVEGVTLRQCAARAGVSHGAPGHHFGDLRGVLTAIAIIGFERLVVSMEQSMMRAAVEDRVSALGAGYARFALNNQAHFSLMFQLDRIRPDDPEFLEASGKAWQLFEREVIRRFGPRSDIKRVRDILWAATHGRASLMISGQMKRPENLEADAKLLFDTFVTTPPPSEGEFGA